MVSVRVKVLVVALVVCLLLHEIHAQRTRARGGGRRNRNRNRGRNPSRQRGRDRPTRQRCEQIQVPMCKGLVGYRRTKLPNRFNHTTQLQVYRVLEHLWAVIDRGCSQNLRLLLCSVFLPKCSGRGPGREPCAATCRKTRKVCGDSLERSGYSWPDVLDCNALPARRCLRKGPDHSCQVDHTRCQTIDMPMCQALALPSPTGMSPNMFGQCNRSEVAMEMEQFRPLLESGCSTHLGYFLCGVYMPFCSEETGMLSFPCRELCLEVRDGCQARYRRLTRGLPWPNKFQCHRYPLSTDGNFTCVMPPGVGAVGAAGAGGAVGAAGAAGAVGDGGAAGAGGDGGAAGAAGAGGAGGAAGAAGDGGAVGAAGAAGDGGAVGAAGAGGDGGAAGAGGAGSTVVV